MASQPKPSPSMPADLVSLLQLRAAQFGSSARLTFLSARGERHVSYEQLHHDAMRVAGVLSSAGDTAARVLLCMPQGYEFVSGLFGSLYAGMIAIPAYPLNDNHARHLPRIIDDSGASIILTAGRNPPSSSAAATSIERCACIDIACLPEDGERLALPRDPNDIAYLQYTSGSTGNPKGVAVTDRNIRENCTHIGTWCGGTSDDVSLSWLPLFHDMGLVFHVLYPLAAGMRSIFMQPMAFLQRPLAWLEMIGKYRATFSGAPNFAFEYCVRRHAAAACSGLDLSSWRIAYAAAEPNKSRTLDAFARTFARHGLRRDALKPAYGLAENTLIATGVDHSQRYGSRRWSSSGLERGNARLAEPGEAAIELVGCGTPVGDQEVRIVDPESRHECAPRRIGEVWLRSGCVARGYWQDTEQTRAVFRAELRDDSAGRTYLRTGDLGFLDGCQLFVVGRIRDLIIVHGRNHHPQDLEHSAEVAHPACVPSACAAFGIDEPEVQGEAIVIVQEVDRATVHRLRSMPELGEDIARCIRARLYDDHAVRVRHVALLAPFRLPKTTSGKVMRQATRRLFASDALAAEWSSQRTSPAPRRAAGV